MLGFDLPHSNSKKGEYDLHHSTVKKKLPIKPCDHNEEKSPTIITEYDPIMCEWVIEYGSKGYYIQGFCGRYNIAEDCMTSWLSDKDNKYKEFKDAFFTAISAAIYYWNKELIHNFDNSNYEILPIIKGILADIIKTSKDFMLKNLVIETPEEIKERNQLGADIALQGAFLGNK